MYIYCTVYMISLLFYVILTYYTTLHATLIRYTEPRKVANQLITVRENVCEEIITDLFILQYENDDATIYATNYVSQGKEYAGMCNII